jgi:hypothetical protein
VLKEAVLEVKSRFGEPPWLAAAIRRTNVIPVEFSKFVAAMRSINSYI